MGLFSIKFILLLRYTIKIFSNNKKNKKTIEMGSKNSTEQGKDVQQ